MQANAGWITNFEMMKALRADGIHGSGTETLHSFVSVEPVIERQVASLHLHTRVLYKSCFPLLRHVQDSF